MGKVELLKYDSLYRDFIDEEFRVKGENECFFRDNHVKKPEHGRRHLNPDEVECLLENGNTATDWSEVMVTDVFDPKFIRNNSFYGLVRIGAVDEGALQYDGLRLPVGITGSNIISCDIGDFVAIHNVHLVSHYIIGDKCILFNINEMTASACCRFGNGIVKDGENEDSRVWLEVMNEGGGRKILPFDGMITADAYLWAKYADDKSLQDRLLEITQNSFDKRRGYYGMIGESCVMKNTSMVRDVKIGSYCYVRGASRIDNATINSSLEEPSVIGENSILVNGIVGYGSNVLYGVTANNFVIGDNCNLKYGARVVNTVVGDNSTISCCEVLNNLIFPAHEQHHNNSFLIASCVMGQSNIAAGATLGSNHNSRAADGEILAKRGFWPGLCTSVKHSSSFASFTLLSKSDYPYEMNITLPFSLVNNNLAKDELEIMPAYWWMYNTYAMARNTSKYRKRDKRKRKIQNIEFDTYAPDSMDEVAAARELLRLWTAKAYIKANGKDSYSYDDKALHDLGKRLLDDEMDTVKGLVIFADNVEKSNRKVRILKAYEAYHAYGDMIIYYAAKNIVCCLKMNRISVADLFEDLKRRSQEEWLNIGGQLMSSKDVDNLRGDIKNGILKSWDDIHDRYDMLWRHYPVEKLYHACLLLSLEMGRPVEDCIVEVLDRAVDIQRDICEQVYLSRKKDYDNEIRNATFRDEEERDAVNGRLEDNSFIIQIKTETEKFINDVEEVKRILL